jgi:GNAT superfamily N-acetyltransferase
MPTEDKYGWRWTFHRAVEILRAEGPRSLFFQVLARLGVYRRLGWYVLPLKEPMADAGSPRDISIEITSLEVSDFDVYATLRPNARKEHFIERLGMGRSCYGVRLAGQLTAVVWVATDLATVDYLSRELFLRERELYLHDAFTDPEHRGQHLQPVLMAWLFERHRALGFEMASRAVMPENRSQIRSCGRAGFRRVGTIGYLRLGPWRWDFTRGESEHLPLSTNRRDAARQCASERR